MPFKLSTLRPAGSEKWQAIGAGSVVSSMSELGVRRDKAALSSGCKPHPATAPAGSTEQSWR